MEDRNGDHEKMLVKQFKFLIIEHIENYRVVVTIPYSKTIKV